LKLYDALFALTESPVVLLNRALAVAELDGARAGLAAMPTLEAHAGMVEYQPYWAARAELLARVGANGESRKPLRLPSDWSGIRLCADFWRDGVDEEVL